MTMTWPFQSMFYLADRSGQNTNLHSLKSSADFKMTMNGSYVDGTSDLAIKLPSSPAAHHSLLGVWHET